MRVVVHASWCLLLAFSSLWLFCVSDGVAEKPDVFDADFNDTETEESDDGEEQEEQLKRTARKQKQKQASAKKGAFVEPKAKKVRITEPREGGAAPSRTVPQVLPPSSMGRRKTTLQKTQEAEKRLREHEAKPKRVQQPKKVYAFTQEELLKEGIETEQANARWLYGMKMMQDEADEQVQGPKMKHQSYIRFLSRRGSYNTVTFSEVDDIPEVISGRLTAPEIPPRECVVTHQPAKYRDPATSLPFANVEAFRVIRSGKVRAR